ncbi:MAG TPA: hypothetical protein VKM54_23280 [Myxococcota bacterium]|nr:hypothetical protein [Myxococcota bacterium]
MRSEWAAFYRLLAVQPQALDGESSEEPLIELLQRQPAHRIEEDQDERPGEPVEKYPLLEAVFRALHSDARECLSLLDGTRHPIRKMQAGSPDGGDRPLPLFHAGPGGGGAGWPPRESGGPDRLGGAHRHERPCSRTDRRRARLSRACQV